MKEESMKLPILTVLTQLVILTSGLTVYAGLNDDCEDWVKTRNGCNYGSHTNTWQWQRDCTNSSNQCGNPNPPHGNRGPCVATVICLPSTPGIPNQSVDPNTDFDVCTRWERQNDVECSDIDGNLVPEWIRVCQKHFIATSVCSRTRPPEWPEEQ